MILRIDHIGIAVVDMVAAGETMAQLSLSRFDTGIAEAYGVACEFWGTNEFNDVAIELVSPAAPDSAVGGVLARQGPGLYHVAFEVDDLDAELTRMRAAGAVPLDREPCRGAREGMRVAFVYLGTATGLLAELVQYSGTT